MLKGNKKENFFSPNMKSDENKEAIEYYFILLLLSSHSLYNNNNQIGFSRFLLFLKFHIIFCLYTNKLFDSLSVCVCMNVEKAERRKKKK